jgi:hypothetical protein
MDWLFLIFIAAGLLFFWGVWIFGYWLPMARESQRQFKAEQARDQAAAERAAQAQPPGTQPLP